MNTTLLAINAAELLLGWIERNKTDPSKGTNASFAKSRREITVVLPLWLGFLVGTTLGAIAYITVGLSCVLLPILPIGSLALWYARLPAHATRESLPTP
jgi:uncharacterized membrane protein YoaK (UPF0700 family)